MQKECQNKKVEEWEIEKLKRSKKSKRLPHFPAFTLYLFTFPPRF